MSSLHPDPPHPSHPVWEQSWLSNMWKVCSPDPHLFHHYIAPIKTQTCKKKDVNLSKINPLLPVVLHHVVITPFLSIAYTLQQWIGRAKTGDQPGPHSPQVILPSLRYLTGEIPHYTVQSCKHKVGIQSFPFIKNIHWAKLHAEKSTQCHLHG